VATVVHRAGTLACVHGAPAPSARLWRVFEDAIERTAEAMSMQDISHCLYSSFTLTHRLGSGARDELLQAAAARARTASPRDLSITLWSLAALELSGWLSRAQREALLAAIPRTVRGLKPEHLCQSLWGIYKLKLHPSAELQRALCAAVVRLGPDMAARTPHVAKSALNALGWRVTPEMAATLAAASLEEEDDSCDTPAGFDDAFKPEPLGTR
jgi:hypothetical protein